MGGGALGGGGAVPGRVGSVAERWGFGGGIVVGDTSSREARGLEDLERRSFGGSNIDSVVSIGAGVFEDLER